MTTEEFDKISDQLIRDCLATMNVTKGADYTTGQEEATFDRLSNFKTVGEEAGLTPLQVWQVWTGKHWDAINRAIKANPQHPVKKGEPLRDNFKDLIVYAILGNALVEEANKNK